MNFQGNRLQKSIPTTSHVVNGSNYRIQLLVEECRVVPRDDDVGVGAEARDGVNVRLEERELHRLVLREHLRDNQVMSTRLGIVVGSHICTTERPLSSRK